MIRKLAFALVLLAGCSAALPFSSSPALREAAKPSISRADRARGPLPPEILYALGGNPRSRSPYIKVFNAQDTGPSPTPLYTIGPQGDAGFQQLAVDHQNYLFAQKFFPSGGSKIYMFAPGATKASTTCALNPYAGAMYVSGGILYLARGSATIEEYAEPLPDGDTCPKPARTLVDTRARRFGSGIYGVVADPHGNVFDVWSSSQNSATYMDEFSAGSSHARLFANLGQSYSTFYLTSDRNGNIITSIYHYKGSTNDVISVFPHGSNVPKLYYPVGPGPYGGLGLANRQSELLILNAYPAPTVHVFDYNPRTASLGKEERRTFGGLWVPGASIAVFSQ